MDLIWIQSTLNGFLKNPNIFDLVKVDMDLKSNPLIWIWI